MVGILCLNKRKKEKETPLLWNMQYHTTCTRRQNLDHDIHFVCVLLTPCIYNSDWHLPAKQRKRRTQEAKIKQCDMKSWEDARAHLQVINL